MSDLNLLQDALDVTHDIPVILCSAYMVFPSKMKSWVADFYVVKSSNLSELKSKIKSVLGGKEAFQHNESVDGNHEPHHTIQKMLSSNANDLQQINLHY